MLSYFCDWHDHCEHYLKYIWNICNISLVWYLYQATMVTAHWDQENQHFGRLYLIKKFVHTIRNKKIFLSICANVIISIKIPWLVSLVLKRSSAVGCHVQFFCVPISSLLIIKWSTMFEICAQETHIVCNTHHTNQPTYSLTNQINCHLFKSN